jgi:urea transport system substrate-binding protein
MGVLAITAEESVSAGPDHVFGTFGNGHGAGWLFGAACDRLEPGAPISITVPLMDGSPVDILGQVAEVRRPRLISIVHDQPWRGRIVLRFSPVGSGTRIRLQVELDERGLEWLMQRRGFPVPIGRSAGPRVGLVTSKSGPAGLFAMASEHVGRMAIDEINADGGVAGEPVELLVADDATDPGTGILQAMRLAQAGCQTIFLNVTSATFVQVARALADTNALLVFPQMNEGFPDQEMRICLGERPADQLQQAAVPLMRAAGGRRWFCAGNDYTWPRRVDTLARAILPSLGGELVGSVFAPIGTTDFSRVIETLDESGVDIVLNTFVGADAAAFERQFHEAGMRVRMRTLALGLDDATLGRIGDQASRGIFGISGYFHTLGTEANSELLGRYRDAVGPWAPPLSTLSESVYEAIHIWAASARACGVTEPQQVAKAMRFGRFDLPRGTVVLNGTDRCVQRLYLAEAHGGQYHVAASAL